MSNGSSEQKEQPSVQLYYGRLDLSHGHHLSIMQFRDKAGSVFQLHSLNSLQMTSNNHQADHFMLSFSYQPSMQVFFVEFYLASIVFEILAAGENSSKE